MCLFYERLDTRSSELSQAYSLKLRERLAEVSQTRIG
jgi:hypothetical protein